MQSFGKLAQRALLQKGNKSFTQAVQRAFTTWHYPVKARVQFAAPKFEGMAFVDGGFKKISLDDYKGKYVVLFFYPLDFTFVCPTEIVEFNQKAEAFRKAGKS